MQNHSFSVSGGSQRTNYRIGLGYTNEDGILITDKDRYERANLSSFLSVEVNKWLTTQLDIQVCQFYPEQSGARRYETEFGEVPCNFLLIRIYRLMKRMVLIYPAETSATYIRYGEPTHC